ncbi:MAG TPA: hypothetical protein VMU51_02865 [Mycobacteriales bacterium]|nr:hypothetical protein [Mycobacteriales bacterium]
MPQSGWDDPTEQVGPTPGSTGVVQSAVAGQPIPLDGTEPLDGAEPSPAAPPVPEQAGPGQPRSAGRPAAGLSQPGSGRPPSGPLDQPALNNHSPDQPVPGEHSLGQAGVDQPGPSQPAQGQPVQGQPGASQPAPDQFGPGHPVPRPEPSAGEPGSGPGPGQPDFGPGAAEPGFGRGPGEPGFGPAPGEPGAGQSGWGQLSYGGEPLAAPGQPLPPAGWRPLPPAPRRPSWQPTRSEIRAGLLAILLLAVLGAGVAVLWWQVAPRLGFRVVTPGNPEPVAAEQEQFFATDGWYMLLTLLVGILATVLGWRVKALRGPAGLVALTAGSLLGAVITWRGGLLLGPAPTEAQLQIVGKVVYPALRLRATAALMVEPLAVVGTYLLLVAFSARPDLGRPDGDGPPPLPPPY